MEENRVKIHDAPFSNRTLNILYGFDYLDEIAMKTASEFLEMKNVGSFSLREIRKVLAMYGLSLKGDILLDSEAEKKLIQDIPKQIREMSTELNRMSRHLNFLILKMDELHCNMQPIK